MTAQPFLGTIYGVLEDYCGVLTVFDRKTNYRLSISTQTQEQAIKICSFINSNVKIIFEITPLLEEGYIMPLQIIRCPEEYSKPIFNFAIATCEDGLATGRKIENGFTLPKLSGFIFNPYLQEKDHPDHPGDNTRSHINIMLRPELYAYLAGVSIVNTACTSLSDFAVELTGYVDLPTIEKIPLFIAKTITCAMPFDEYVNKKQEALNKRYLLPPKTIDQTISDDKEQIAPQKNKRRSIPTTLRYAVLRRDNHRCVDCGASAQDDPFVRLEIDHRFPVSKGGGNEIENLQTLCWDCNNGKRDQIDHKLDVSVLSDDLWNIAA